MLKPTHPARRRLAALPVLLLVVLLGQSMTPSPAAALNAPGGLSPAGEVVNEIPVLSWTSVSNATAYNVEVSASPSFSPTLWKSRTSNIAAVPTVPLPPGQLYWRVRASKGTTYSTWSEGDFERTSDAGPLDLVPADGATIAVPDEPTIVSWGRVSGAASYTVQVSTSSDLVGATSATVKGNSYLAPALTPQTTYYWRVKANLSTAVSTEWSLTNSLIVGELPQPTLESPADSVAVPVQDVTLDWDPVVGAASYALQVSTNASFTSYVANLSKVTGTSYTPTTTWKEGRYYWRVRPVDAQGFSPDWSEAEVWTFSRSWTAQPTLEYPIGGATVGDPFFYQWTPVTLADRYSLELSTHPNFGPGDVIDVCSTVLTTYTPDGAGDCYPQADGTYYWRVIAQDNPGQGRTAAASAQVGSFTYTSPRPTYLSPANGATTSLPTLSWAPVNGAAKYIVSIDPVAEGQAGGGTFFTTATSFTPRSALVPGVQYRWEVRTQSVSGRRGSVTPVGSQRTFTVSAAAAPTASTPDPLGSPVSSARFPTLKWKSVVNADFYKIQVRPVGTTSWTYLDDVFFTPAGEDDTTDWLTPGTYQWRVEAYDAGALLSASAFTSTFTITSIAPATGLKVGMTGQSLGSAGTSCSVVAPASCESLRQTPVFGWNADPEAAFYKIFVAKDAALTTMVTGYPLFVESSRLAPLSAMAESLASGTYYWYVQPCRAANKCATLGTATSSFTKTSKPVQLQSPADEATVTDEVSFAWRDYLATNLDATASPVVGGSNAHTVAPRSEARQYRIQVSATAAFTTTIDNLVVDQAAYVPFSATYPEGDLYWRVQAIDGTSNALSWSDTFHLVKASTAAVPTSPVGDTVESGTPVLRWEARPFAASYKIEVFRNDDTAGASTNRVVSAISKQAAYVPTTPLPVSDSAYRWRVRTVDVKGRLGPWSSLTGAGARFTVAGAPVTLVAPSGGDYVAAKEGLFSWESVPDASAYKILRRKVGATSASSTKTSALSWAPTSAFRTGNWQWRVSSLDAAGKVLESSSWRNFKVDATAPKVKTNTPTRGVPKGTNFVVTFSEPVRNVDDTTFTIKAVGSSNTLNANVNVAGDRMKATLNPNSALTAGKKYLVKLTTDITDDQGNPMARAFTWTVTAK